MSSCCSSHIQTPGLCSCGFSPVLRTSWTDANPGRRFWGCSQYVRNRSRDCNFHMWHDPAVGDRAKNIIPGLLRRIQRLEDEIMRRRNKEKMLFIWLISALVIICFLVIVCVVIVL
ncbi:hypothetical protein DCAR_0520400 [Daucus carota subsp. sativus]|uniref:GRF-type domain-containing protein n=1 Tax=Daucus carota subsp. sativus TaxID=79200 RepID=A0AAF0X5V0_DAUCS|nr:PREDICTED: uncharacterized protein LOC108221525 [Daucus carota subsp. sativus]WOH01022.1 hypothetical protein DCAR_0520400 [Daucus carota subsp. sativus]